MWERHQSQVIAASSLPVRHTCTRPSALNLEPLAASHISCTVLLELSSNTLCTRPPLLPNSATYQDFPTKCTFSDVFCVISIFPHGFMRMWDPLFAFCSSGFETEAFKQCGLMLTPSFDLSNALTQDLWLLQVVFLCCLTVCPVPVQPVFVLCHVKSSSSASTSKWFCWDLWIKSVKHWRVWRIPSRKIEQAESRWSTKCIYSYFLNPNSQQQKRIKLLQCFYFF